MKKSIIVILALALLAAFPAPVSSWYNAPNEWNATGLALHSNLGWQNFSASSFDTRYEGFYRLALVDTAIPVSYDELFATSFSGLVKLTGSCLQTKSSNITLRMWLDGQAQPVTIAETNAARFTFTQVFLAGNLLLQGITHDAGRYDVVKCSLLFEKVQ